MPENQDKEQRLPGPRSIVSRPLSEMTETERQAVLDEDRKVVEEREAAIAKAKSAPSSTRRTGADSE